MRKNSTLTVLYFHKTSHLKEKSVLFLKKDNVCMEGIFFFYKFMGRNKFCIKPQSKHWTFFPQQVVGNLTHFSSAEANAKEDQKNVE